MTFRFMPLCARPPCHLHRPTCRERYAADADEVCLPRPERGHPLFPLPPASCYAGCVPFCPAPPPSRAPPQGAEPNCPSLSAIARRVPLPSAVPSEHTESTQRTAPPLANTGFSLNSPLNSVPPAPSLRLIAPRQVNFSRTRFYLLTLPFLRIQHIASPCIYLLVARRDRSKKYLFRGIGVRPPYPLLSSSFPPFLKVSPQWFLRWFSLSPPQRAKSRGMNPERSIPRRAVAFSPWSCYELLP